MFKLPDDIVDAERTGRNLKPLNDLIEMEGSRGGKDDTAAPFNVEDPNVTNSFMKYVTNGRP